MNIKKKILFLFPTLLLFAFFATPVLADLGLSPSDWAEPSAMPGQEIKKVFFLSRSDASEDLNFTTKINGEIANWLTIENGSTFKIPKGEQQYPVSITLKVPKDAAVKQYKGEIRLSSSSGAPQGGQIGVVLGALIRIDLTVSNKPFINYNIFQIEAPVQESGENVEIVLNINNEGNVEAKPTKVEINIFNKFYSAKLTSQTIEDFSKIKGVPAFSQGKISLNIPFHLEPEQYWADIVVYQDDKVLKTDHLTFEVVKAGTLKKNILVGLQGVSSWILWAGVALLVVVIIVIVIVIVAKKRKGGGTVEQDEENDDSIKKIKIHG